MKVLDDWLDAENYDKAEQRFVDGVMGRADGEMAMNALIADAAWDAGFEAGVLASEAGVGRADN